MSKRHAALNRRLWERARRLCFERDGYRCCKCGLPGRLECHHVAPLESGGTPYDLVNLETVCTPCHKKIHGPKIGPDRPGLAGPAGSVFGKRGSLRFSPLKSPGYQDWNLVLSVPSSTRIPGT